MGYMKGKIYKWRSKNDINIVLLGSLLDNYECTYCSYTQNLTITNLAYSNDEVFNFKCSNIEAAEVIVKSFISGMNVDALPEFKI